MRKYDSYKDSGVDWIGGIPSHWTKSKLKFVSEIITGNTPPTKDEDNYEGGEFLWVKPNEINGFTPTNDTSQKLTEKGKALSRVLPPFSVLVNGIGRIGEFGYSEKSVSTNQQINSIVYNHKVDKRYGLFHTSMMKEGFVSNSQKVVVPILNKTKQENLEFIIPPLSEQQQIVSFLDTKTSLIDSLIKKTQQKIELLKEKRTSLINEVVTKGLNPNVEMKDSGVEWIGEIPSHWEVKKIKHHSVVNVGLVINPSTHFDDNGTVPILTGKNVKVSGIDLEDVDFITEESNELLWKTKIYEGDLVSMRVGYPGRTSIVTMKEDGINCCSVIITRKSNTMNSKLLVFQVNSKIGKVQVELCQGGMGQQVVNLGDWNEFRVITPPQSEQNQIVSYLDEHTQLIDKTISVEQRRIKLLKEYRQSLISEMVTGKIKPVELMISYEEFLNKLMNCSGEKNLKVLLVKMYQSILSGQMIFINLFIHKCIVRDNKNISLEDYVNGLLEYFNKYKVGYFKRVKEIENGGLWGNIRISERDHLKTFQEFIEIIDDYLDFVDMTKNIKNIKITPLEFLEKFINKVNSFSITRKSSPEDLYRYLDFDWVESFGYDDGIHDVVNNYKGYWSDEYKLGFITYPKVIEHFDEKYLFELRLVNLKDSLNKHSF